MTISVVEDDKWKRKGVRRKRGGEDRIGKSVIGIVEHEAGGTVWRTRDRKKKINART